VAQRSGAVPVTLAHDVLTVALADPTNVLALDDIRLATKLASVRTAVATASDVQEAVNRYYGGATAGGVGDTFGALADVEGLEAGEEREEELEAVGDVDDAPVVRLVNAIRARPCTAAPPTSTSSPRSATSGSATASTGCCARSPWSPSRSRGR
jgi:type IV pilus assembly protein PilB